jgi:hypothetical protein
LAAAPKFRPDISREGPTGPSDAKSGSASDQRRPGSRDTATWIYRVSQDHSMLLRGGSVLIVLFQSA